MSRNMVFLLGKIVLLIGAFLELRHLAEAIAKQFSGCDSLPSVVAKALSLDDATLGGVLLCGLLVFAIAINLRVEFEKAKATPTQTEHDVLDSEG